MAQIFSYLSIGSYVLAVAFLLLAIFFWFKFGVKKVYNDLSGRTAKKTIEQMREKNEKKAKKIYHSASYQEERALQTDSIVRKVKRVDETADLGGLETADLKQQDITATLSNNRTASGVKMETSLLNSNVGETSALNDGITVNAMKEPEEEMVVLQSIILTGTDELIEINSENK